MPHATIDYIISKIYERFPHIKESIDINPTFKNNLEEYIARSMEILRTGKYVDSWKGNTFATYPDGSQAHFEPEYYTITPNGESSLELIKVKGRERDYDKVVLELLLPRLDEFGENDLNKFKLVIEKLGQTLDVEKVKRYMYKHNFCDTLEGSVVVLTSRGRTLRRLGKINLFFKYIKEKRARKEEKEKLEISLLKSADINLKIQKNQERINGYIAAATIIAGLTALSPVVKNEYFALYDVYHSWIVPTGLSLAIGIVIVPPIREVILKIRGNKQA